MISWSEPVKIRTWALEETVTCPLLIMLCLGLMFSGRSIADIGPEESRVAVHGLDAGTEILIDRWGVPHIYSATRHDVFFAQGWNAARDRLWQIDMWRRSGIGELAAVLGASYLAQDRAIRLFMYRGAIDKEWAAYGPDVKRNAEAFVAGINAFISAAMADPALMPQEFKLAGYAPAFWKPDDIVRVRNHGLVAGIYLQVMRAQIACKAGVAAATLYPKVSPPWDPVVPQGLDLCSIPPNVLDQYQLAQKPVVFGPQAHHAAAQAQKLTAFSGALLGGRGQGSNNWAIAPARTTTGRPILANDPHRSDEVPSLRYIAHLVAPGLDVIGAGEPALPGISIGHNGHIAFGLTVFLIAQEDLCVYETNPRNPNEYRYLGEWEPMQVIHESIASRGDPDDVEELKFTRHGPVVMEDPDHHRAYAVRATWLDTGGTPYLASMLYLGSHNVKQFTAALDHWGEPGENQLYADTAGTIGWFPAGFTPIRPNSDGLLPLPCDGRYEWQGYLERKLLPSELNPAAGYIATANQMNLPRDYPYAKRRVGFLWADDSRFRRIGEVIDKIPRTSKEDSEELQNDYLTLPGRRLIGVLNGIQTSDQHLADVIQWLSAWDSRVTASSPQAALYEVWVSHHLGSTVMAQAVPSMPASFREHISGSASEIVDLMVQPDQRLGPNPEKTRDDIMLGTLASAFEETKQRLGPDRSTWRWGRLATVLFEHQLSTLANDSERAKMNVGPAPKDGDDSVVGNAYYRSKDFRLQAGASFRMVLDVGKWDNSVAINTPGQSGNPSSAHYRDLFPLWLAGEYFPLLYSRSAVKKATEHRILLVPR
jgi:penicillin G amidase